MRFGKGKHNLKNDSGKPLFLTRVFNIFFLIITVLGAGTAVFMNTVNRDLWLDESSMAYSFSQRSLLNLCTSQFEYHQPAPVGWLYICKIFTIIFGNRENVLRITSLLAFIGILILLAVLARINHLEFFMAPSAFAANMPYLLMYSNVFKPYISDGFFVLLTILLFWLFLQKKISLPWLAVIWSILLWFSNPTAFIEGGLIISCCLFALSKRDFKRIRDMMIVGVSILTSFGIYYFLWLRYNATSDYMQDYWEGNKFPLLLFSKENIKTAGNLIHNIFLRFDPLEYIFILLFILGLISAVLFKDELLCGIGFGILLTLAASAFGMYPIQDRLCCFFYPLAILTVFVTIHRINMPGWKETLLLGLFCLLTVAFENGILHYSIRDNVYWKGEEISPQIEYIRTHLSENDLIYVNFDAMKAWQYKEGYGNTSFIYEDNVILGTKRNPKEDEVKAVIERNRSYIVTSHAYGTDLVKKYERFWNALDDAGYLWMVQDKYETPLFCFCKDINDVRLHVGYSVLDKQEKEDTVEAVIQITNDGEGIINHPYEDVFLKCDEPSKMYKIPEGLHPGESCEITVVYPKGITPSFTLQNEDGPICRDTELVIE